MVIEPFGRLGYMSEAFGFAKSGLLSSRYISSDEESHPAE